MVVAVACNTVLMLSQGSHGLVSALSLLVDASTWLPGNGQPMALTLPPCSFACLRNMRGRLASGLCSTSCASRLSSTFSCIGKEQPLASLVTLTLCEPQNPQPAQEAPQQRCCPSSCLFTSVPLQTLEVCRGI